VVEVLDDRIKSAVLVIGGAAKLYAGRARSADLFFERLHQAGFANPWLTTQQRPLSRAVFGLRPAPLQYAQLFLASDQRSYSGLHLCKEVVFGFPLPLRQWQEVKDTLPCFDFAASRRSLS
jgi:hypothetical protein